MPGEVTERTEQFTDDRGPKSTPLRQFYRAIRGESIHVATNERALFDFACLTAIAECAETEKPRRVTREDDRVGCKSFRDQPQARTVAPVNGYNRPYHRCRRPL